MPKGKKEDDTGFRVKVEKKQETMKRNPERRNPIREKEIVKGDWVRVKGKDGWYRDYTQVTDIDKSSVQLGEKGKWPLKRVSTRIRRDPVSDEWVEVKDNSYSIHNSGMDLEGRCSI